jgi:hypothetical protein
VGCAHGPDSARWIRTVGAQAPADFVTFASQIFSVLAGRRCLSIAFGTIGGIVYGTAHNAVQYCYEDPLHLSMIS